jgi:hypothetical protein
MFESNLKRLCLDTNVYIIGTQNLDSDEAKILRAVGYYGREYTQLEAEIVLSPELIDQIRRVSKYLWNKDKAGWVLGLIWSRLNTYYVTPNEEWRNLLSEVSLMGNIPTEDLEVFLTAKLGLADCFVSTNRELIRAIADFECLTPATFVSKYLLLLN